MIACAHCGTLNRKGSKYCSNCGQRLEAAAGIACPICSRLSPPGSTFCQFCGATFVPSKEDAENGEPQPPAAQPEVERPELLGADTAAAPPGELPSWLYEQPTTEPKARQAASKYLQDIPGILPYAGPWLASSHKAQAAEPTPTSDKGTESPTKQCAGCLSLGVAAVLGIVGIIVTVA